MNIQMETMISKDLGMNIDKVRKSSWKELDKTVNKEKGKVFRPDKEVGLFTITLRNFYRNILYKCKCLMKGRKK